MIEDKLSRKERIRLECLAQANITHAVRPAGPNVIIDTAVKFEKYITNDEDG